MQACDYGCMPACTHVYYPSRSRSFPSRDLILYHPLEQTQNPRAAPPMKLYPVASEQELAALAATLVSPGTRAERALLRGATEPDPDRSAALRDGIRSGGDPLGEAFLALRPPQVRRKQGAIYTPQPIVDAMVSWAAEAADPKRIVDPGAGSGRFLFAAARVFPEAELLGVEIDPLAALILRANAAILGFAGRLTLRVADYRSLSLPAIRGATLFVGNPPYVRHHDIPSKWKDWLATTAAEHGLKASKLAGLHAHFLLKTRDLARAGDYGAFITAAEWLDTNYGAFLRQLFVNGIGGTALHVLAPEVQPFGDTATTGAIACFHTGRSVSSIRMRSISRLEDLGSLARGRRVAKSRLETARRWSPFLRPHTPAPRGLVELGEFCRVHRGQVTGCNAVWIEGAYSEPLPEAVLVPTVTRARELFGASGHALSVDGLRRIIALPPVLEELALDETELRQVRAFLRWARKHKAHATYVARHRPAWWSVSLREPAPILCTYMARRPPAFVRNTCGAHHINIAHGIYPREPMPEHILDALTAWLHENTSTAFGRTYAGGLTKFEPKEVERLLVPPPEALTAP